MMKAQAGTYAILALILIITVGAVTVGAVYVVYLYVHYNEWTRPSTYSGVVSSFTKHIGFPFHVASYRIEFYGGSNLTIYEREFTLAKGWVNQTVDVGGIIKPSKNCTINMVGAFIKNATCG
jgi:hypothetical protein